MNKYYENESGILYYGECLEVMDELIKQGVKVDVIIADPPFGVTSNSEDKEINLEKLIKIITKFNCPIIIFGQDTAKNKFASKCKINIPNYKYSWFWNKELKSGFLNAKKQPLRMIEEIMVFYDKQGTYNPQMVIGEPNHSKGTKHLKKECKNNNYNKFKSVESNLGNLKYPGQLLNFKKPHPSITLHPTQKSLPLMEYLIETNTNKNDVVLDFTAGSGVTLLACQLLGRKFIGIEIQEKYCKIIKDNLELKTNKKDNK